MGYFDDPKHKAQWEKELSQLREDKARIKADLQPVSGEAEHTADKNFERSVPENDFADEQKFEAAPEEKTAYRNEPEKEQYDEALSKPRAVKKAPESRPVERERPEGTYRIKTSFQELLREENMEPPQKLTQKPRELERQKEVSHEL